MILEETVLFGAWLATIGLLLGIIWARKWHFDRKKLRLPVTEKLLRTPGEHLQKKLEEVEEKLSTELAIAFVLPFMCASLYLIARNTPTANAASVGVGIAGVAAFKPATELLCVRRL